jgi:hypothetical protein
MISSRILIRKKLFIELLSSISERIKILKKQLEKNQAAFLWEILIRNHIIFPPSIDFIPFLERAFTPKIKSAKRGSEVKPFLYRL